MGFGSIRWAWGRSDPVGLGGSVKRWTTLLEVDTKNILILDTFIGSNEAYLNFW